MEDKNNEQKQVISDLEKRIKEQDTLITSLTDKNKDINETVKEDNESLRAQNTDLESKVSQLKNESDTQIKQLENQLKQQQAELKQAEEKNAEFRKKLESTQQQLEQENTDLTNQLKDSISKLNAAKKEKKDLEGGVKELKEKVQTLEENNVEIEKQKADLEKKLEFSQGENKKLQEQVEHLSQEREKATSIAISSVENNVETLSETLKNQQIESSKPEDINKKTKAQAKTQALDTVSITKSTTKSTLSKLRNFPNKIFRDKSLNNFLSKKNEELKKSFPEFKGEHFCHNVLEKTIKSLQYQNGYKFKSDKLLGLLESNFEESGRAIIETKVNEVVEELAKDFVKKHDLKQVIFVEECAKELYLNEKDGKAILNSFTEFLAQGNVSNNDSVKKFIVKELIKAQIKCFSDKVQQLASSIRDKFLSPDQGMCVQTSKENNEYELTDKAKKEYTPNSSMSHSNTTNVSKGRFK